MTQLETVVESLCTCDVDWAEFVKDFKSRSVLEDIISRLNHLVAPTKGIYHEVLEDLENVIKDGKFTISAKMGVKDEFHQLLSLLEYIPRHTGKESIRKIFEKLSSIIMQMNDFDVSEEYKKKSVAKTLCFFI